MSMTEQAMPQERASLIVVTRFDGERVTQEAKPEPKKHKPRKLPKALSPEQTEQFFGSMRTKCATAKRNMAMFQTMLRAGLRVSEVCDLSVPNVDLEMGVIHVQNGKGGVDRNLPIGSCLMEWLVQWSKIRPQNSPYFFCAIKGTRIMPRYINQVLERLSNESGVYIQDGLKQGPVHAHCLRHTFATNMLRKGLNLPQIQKLMGHSSIQITQIYLMVTDEELDAAVKALG